MSRKLLLADDSITIQKVIQITFAHEDYELTIADNGDVAFAKAQEIKPDLVMADVYMPGRNGYELCAAIKQDPALQGTPVLLLAGSFEPFDEEKAKSARADSWIEKPFESQALIDKVSELLSTAPRVEPVAPELPVADSEASTPTEPASETFAESVSEELMAAASPTVEDPFGDISFEEGELMAEETPTETVVDDWTALGERGQSVETAAKETEETFTFALEESASEGTKFSALDETPIDEAAFGGDEDFTFDEEPAEMAPVADVDSDASEETEEVMQLGDDDILGAEDLESAPKEPTLASWSRDEVGSSEVFSEAFDNEFSAEAPDVSEELSEVDEEIIIEEGVLPSFDAETVPPVEQNLQEAPVEPVAPLAVEEEVEEVEEIEPAAMSASLEEVEDEVAGLSEADLEAIVEKVAARMIGKLADKVLERIAWEVVPDLAESLIREEIRKIKEAAA